MLHEVETVLSMGTGLAEIHRQGAVADHRMQRDPEAHGVIAIGCYHLPGKLTAGPETTDVTFKREFLSRGDLMPNASAHDWIDPFKSA